MGKLDRFDKFDVETMTKEEHQKKQAYITKNCRCLKCPTYVQGDSPVGYCFPLVGTSRKIQWEKSCVCNTCPIFKEYELNHTFYCTRCSQICQTLKVEVAGGQGGAG
ncbi:MAG: DUF2769 domain-containing protein [Deltaproteobacteria bacterium]|nr:DUF2769 domain-containing protein [Deltaproteobacteria bacterium]